MRHIGLSLIVSALFWLAVPDSGAGESPHPRNAEFRQHYDDYKKAALCTFYLGLHGELILPTVSPNAVSAAQVFALPSKNEGMDLLAVRFPNFVPYASVSKDGSIRYEQTPEAKSLTLPPFCGIAHWPEKAELEKSSQRGARIFANMDVRQTPPKPENCEAVAYATADGGVFFGPQEGIHSPFPLWLLRGTKYEMQLVSPDRMDLPILSIKATDTEAGARFLVTSDFKPLTFSRGMPYPFFAFKAGVRPPSGDHYLTPFSRSFGGPSPTYGPDGKIFAVSVPPIS